MLITSITKLLLQKLFYLYYMSNTLVLLLLNLIGFITILVWIIHQFKDFFTLSFKSFFTWKRFKYPTLLSIIIGVPLVVLNYTPYSSYYHINDLTYDTYKIYCWVTALIISMVWLTYILKLDVFEKEKWIHIAITFVLSFFATYLCDFLYPLFSSFGFDFNGLVLNEIGRASCRERV